MPQDGSGNYAYPLGTRGVPDETIESAAYNNFLDDLVGNDLNTPRPIHRGGTGATTADAALVNLSAEKAAQLVTNYDTHVWFPGSFRSAGSATGMPVAGHAFSGIVYINEPLANPPTNANVTVSARDIDDTVVPSRVYVREKKAGTWGAWTVIDATTLPFPPSGSIAGDTIIEAIQELDADIVGKVAKSGGADGIMTGFLTLNADPTAALHAVTKQYVDAAIAAAIPTELRFVRASSQYMTRTFTSNSALVWTLSIWCKRVGLGTHQALFGSDLSTNRQHIGFSASNFVAIFGGAAGTTEVPLTSAGTFTDPNAWINIVWQTTTAALAPVAKFFDLRVNGAATITGTGNDPGFNTASFTHYIGQPSFYPDVIMKEVIFVDGATVAPSAFGETIGGVWTPKLYTGSYGTNGFKLNFSNQRTNANLGLDSSGNNNNWTAFNF